MPSPALCQLYPNTAGCEGGGLTLPPVYNTGGGVFNPNNYPTNTGNNSAGGSGQGVYSTTLQAILSGLALWQRANYIPTPLQQGQTPYGATPQQPTIQYLDPIGGGGATPRTNAFGGIQQYIQEHPLPVLGGVILLGALLMRPPVQRARY